MDDALPANYVNFRNCPSIYRLTDPQGKERLWVFAARTATGKEVIKDMPDRLQGYMPRIVSEDDGKTWRELPPIGGRISKDDPFRCIMTFSSIVRLKDNSYLGMFHRGSGLGEEGTLQVLQSITRDGGFTWSQPVMACDGTQLDGKHPCEPYVFRSPDGDELCCLMRENRRSGTSLVMFSRDDGKTWSQAVDCAVGPHGRSPSRHHAARWPPRDRFPQRLAEREGQRLHRLGRHLRRHQARQARPVSREPAQDLQRRLLPRSPPAARRRHRRHDVCDFSSRRCRLLDR
ncbi:MAG UNVERIFIED_CONTAM: glycoside hydrolase [Planctomycetaceae bacterium]